MNEDLKEVIQNVVNDLFLSNSTTSKQNESIFFTSCSDYRSIIHVTHEDAAGLADRATIIEGFGSLATWLCAKLIIPPPEIWLAENHNNNHKIQKSLGWSTYLKTERRHDQSSFLGNASDLLHSKHCQKITTSSKSTLSNNLNKAYQIVQTGGCFCWKIDLYFYKNSRYMQKEVDKYPRSPRLNPYEPYISPITTCQLRYVSVSTSLFVQRAALTIAPKEPYSSLHIRQIGMERKCNLTAPIIMNYTRCVKEYVPATKILIVFTDIKELPYFNELNEFLLQQWEQVIWGDQVIYSRYGNITKNDNYMTYAIASTMIGNSAVQLSTAKKGCPKGHLPCLTYADCHPCARVNFRGSSEQKKLLCASCPKEPLCMEK